MGLAWGINWLATLAVLARIGAALAVLPPFGHSTVPRRVRALIAVALAIFLLSGGEHFGKKTVNSDADLPPVAQGK